MTYLRYRSAPPNDDITGYKYWFFPVFRLLFLALPNVDQRRDKNQKITPFQKHNRLGLPDVLFYVPGEGLNAIVI